jgi:hypothetical protein
VAKNKQKHKVLNRLAAMFVGNPVMISGFNVRGARIVHMKTDGGLLFV